MPKYFLIILLINLTYFSACQTRKNEDSNKNKDSTTNEKNVVKSKSESEIKSEYIRNYLIIENLLASEGYGRFDIPGYDKKKATLKGTFKNIGNRSVDEIQITVYFLDSDKKRIGETRYYPVSTYSFAGDDTPLKPNYVRDWGYVIEDDAPSGWNKTVEVEITDITFTK